jgi:hypothetical protein
MSRAKKEARRNAEERLNRNLSHLESFCNAGDPLSWPPQWLLKEITNDVHVLYMLERVKRPSPVWEAFEHVDKRKKKLQLELRVKDVIHRALAICFRQSELEKTVLDSMRGDAQAQRSLRNMILNAKNPAKLFWQYRELLEQQCRARPFIHWLVEIHHPMAEDFWGKLPSVEWEKTERRLLRKRDAGRRRSRKWRKAKKKIRRNSVAVA